MKTIVVHTTYEHCEDKYIDWYCGKMEAIGIGKELARDKKASLKSEYDGVVATTTYEIKEEAH